MNGLDGADTAFLTPFLLHFAIVVALYAALTAARAAAVRQGRAAFADFARAGGDPPAAARIQRNLLPQRGLRSRAWEVAYHYEPAGVVSGDYCDLIRVGDGELYFILGDVSGKGVAASLLMSNLQAMFHALIPVGFSLDELMARASRLFCESTLSTHFATLVVGKASQTGEVELCNAGHLPPLLLQHGATLTLDSTGLPVGVFCDEHFTTIKVQLAAGDALLLYTDGVTETQDESGNMYGIERLVQAMNTPLPPAPEELMRLCVSDLARFRGEGAKLDDLTLMAIRRAT